MNPSLLMLQNTSDAPYKHELEALWGKGPVGL